MNKKDIVPSCNKLGTNFINPKNCIYKLGIDIGSTTVKLAVLDSNNKIIYSIYKRHYSDIKSSVLDILKTTYQKLDDIKVSVAITGSGGLFLAKLLNINFIQEVIASKSAIEFFIPMTDVAIELGGEDAKIIYLNGGIEQRMNGTCAGGTGAFIDQMSTLLNTDAQGLNKLAKKYKTIYPIASRCGVFAKTDIQPLLNEGAKKEDIAASIFQSVVTQTISGLACGRPIKGHVAFLGGPLQYLDELRKLFYKTLNLDDEHIIVPDNAHLFVASGAAIQGNISETKTNKTVKEIIDDLHKIVDSNTNEVQHLNPLFKNKTEYKNFIDRHKKAAIQTFDIKKYKGNIYLGIDAGSTTFKSVAISQDCKILYKYYANNQGNVLGTCRNMLEDFFNMIPKDSQGNDICKVAHCTVTGYGERFLLEAVNADSGEVETIAHLRGAQQLDRNVEFILDIGGQDMKCLQIKDGVIENIMLNEACSSGCGSFIESFAKSLNIKISDFANLAIESKMPVDLGSRCTVFMNSRVKQAQKEGASVSDISAGLSYSVIKNALYKVIKLRDTKALGNHIVVQGGTFLNDAILKAFENLTKHEVIRPNIAGHMGAYGAALLAWDRFNNLEKQEQHQYKSTLLSASQIDQLKIKHTTRRCQGCENNCLLTINDFGVDKKTNKRKIFITGNKCERGASKVNEKKDVPNLFKYKNDLIFNREVLEKNQATRGSVGIPRVLNMFENYPFWHSFFTTLGFRVVLSDKSSKKTYQRGIESMPSESVCYPAKLSHGHIMDLLGQDIDFIWMPCIRWERKEDNNANNHFNCPIVMSYSESLKLNIDELKTSDIKFLNPYIPYENKKSLKAKLFEQLGAGGLYSKLLNLSKSESRKKISKTLPSKKEISNAVDIAWQVDIDFKKSLQKKGEEVINWIDKTNSQGIVLAGRPYHIDSEINHAIPELITSFGIAVLTEDSVSHLSRVERNLRIYDQWMYHTRLFNSAKFVCTKDNINLVQLNSFGCGIDALTTDQVQEILEGSHKLYTLLKIDEVSNLGAVRIRIRSLIAALKQQEKKKLSIKPQSTEFKRVEYTKQMKQNNWTILAPQMAPYHFDLLLPVFKHYGYNLELLPAVDENAVNCGLKYVNNDICYPSILVTGQIMEAVISGKYDTNKLAILISQTGGGCRATNYISLIRKALKDSGHSNIPVIALELNKTNESNSGWKITPKMVKTAIPAFLFGDLLMQCLYRTRPYEKYKNSANNLFDKWMNKIKANICSWKYKDCNKAYKEIINDFDNLECVDFGSKPRVGVVGEILVKFHPTANNHIVDIIESEGCEANVPGLTDFFLFGLANKVFRHKQLTKNWKEAVVSSGLIKLAENLRNSIRKAQKESNRFDEWETILHIADKASNILDLCNMMGEGWLLTGEMVELIEGGTENIVCTQPFACLPNHVVGKSVIKELRRQYPKSNIIAIDYDPGASEVNQLNRIKLMISVAKANKNLM